MNFVRLVASKDRQFIIATSRELKSAATRLCVQHEPVMWKTFPL